MGLLGTRAAFLVQLTRGVFHKSLQVVEAGALCTAAVDFVSSKCPQFERHLTTAGAAGQAAVLRVPRADRAPSCRPASPAAA